LLNYTRLFSGSLSLHSDAVNIEEVMDAVIRDYNCSLKAGVELTTTVPPGFPNLLHGDPLRYRQVLQNLVYLESGYIKVFIFCYEDEQQPGRFAVRTEVGDTGIGVPDNAVNTPFTRFATQRSGPTRELH
jgi:osomolarity two-component system sensor histidine kinase TcsA